MNWCKSAVSRIKDFVTSREEAIAAVEFALIMPFLLVLYMGSLEVSQIIAVDRKMAAATGALGDLVARNNGSLDTDTLNDYFAAVGLIMTPYSADNLKQLVTVVHVDSDGDTSVEWSVAYNGATAKTEGNEYILPSEITDIATDTYVVVAEAEIPYQPWGGYVIDSTITLYRQYFHLPRFGAFIELT